MHLYRDSTCTECSQSRYNLNLGTSNISSIATSAITLPYYAFALLNNYLAIIEMKQNSWLNLSQSIIFLNCIILNWDHCLRTSILSQHTRENPQLVYTRIIHGKNEFITISYIKSKQCLKIHLHKVKLTHSLQFSRQSIHR